MGLKLYRGEPRGDSEMTPRSRNPFRLGVPGVGFLLVGMIVVISSLIGLNCGTVIFLSIAEIQCEGEFLDSWRGVKFSEPYDRI